MDNLEKSISHAAETIRGAQSFLLTCHVNPDGDALGSTAAMAHALKANGKTVVATFAEPFIVPYNLEQSLPGLNDILTKPSDISESFDVMMSFDCGSRTRLMEVDSFFDSAGTVINVDHHISNEGFGDINVIDVNAASSGTVVLDILDACGYEINREAAQCLYVALLTDTGRFQFSSTTPKVFAQAGRLAEFDLPIAELSRVLTEEDAYAFLKLAGEALADMEFDEATGVVSAVATIDMQKRHGVAYNEIEGLIELVRRTRESDVACIVKEFAPGDYRGSLRSLGTIDVCEIASSFGGGGHRYASGFSTTQSPSDVISIVRAAVAAQRK